MKAMKTSFAEYEITDLGVMMVRIITSMTNTLETAQADVEVLKSLCGSERRPLLVDLTKAKRMDEAARQYYIEMAPDYATRLAVVTPSLLTKVTGNFFMAFMTFGRQPIPTRLVRDVGEGMAWLL